MDPLENRPIEQPGVPPTSSELPVATSIVTTSFLATKVAITIIVALLLAGGAGAYFVFLKKPASRNAYAPRTNEASKSNTVSQQSISAPFHCTELLPEADFKAIAGYDSSAFKTSEGENTESNQYNCSWVGTGNDQGKTVQEKFGTAGQGYTIAILWGEKNLDAQFPNGKIFNNPLVKVVPVVDVGSKAYANSDEQGKPSGILRVLSTNKKYVLIISDMGSILAGNDTQGITREKAIGKVMDANLNKY